MEEAKGKSEASAADVAGESTPPSDTASEEERLLEDLNSALHDITTGTGTKSVSNEDSSNLSGSQSQRQQHVTLTKTQLTSLLRLEKRVRSSLTNQQRELRSSIARQQEQFTNLRRRVITGDSNKRVRDVTRAKVRKAVTGDPERPLSEWAQDAKVVKAVDKFSFCLGVLVLCTTEYMLLVRPEQFGLYYVVLVSIMMALRLYMYAKSRYLYFLLDFCYWANATCFLAVLYLPDNQRLWRLNFAISNGTLLGALLAWRNSLVFHSLDKVTSIAIHLLPGLLTFIERWSNESKMCAHSEASSCSLGIRGSILDPVLFYSFWQMVYIFKTEVVDRKRMLADPSIQTSLRWLTRDRKNAMHKISKKICRTIGVLKPDEEFDPEALKTKLVFWIGQLIFTIITLLPTHFLFASQELNIVYILYTCMCAIWNGANFYFEVFAARYIQKLEASEKEKQEASEAAAKQG